MAADRGSRAWRQDYPMGVRASGALPKQPRRRVPPPMRQPSRRCNAAHHDDAGARNRQLASIGTGQASAGTERRRLAQRDHRLSGVAIALPSPARSFRRQRQQNMRLPGGAGPCRKDITITPPALSNEATPGIARAKPRRARCRNRYPRPNRAQSGSGAAPICEPRQTRSSRIAGRDRLLLLCILRYR
jgi:hypothetical protein